MARKQESDEDDVSLFPFLSILSCVIGVLTLLITAMAISQMDTPEIVETEQLDDLLAEEQQLTAKIEELEAAVRDSDQEVVELLTAQEKQALLLEQLKAAQEKVEQAQQKVDPDFVQVDLDSKIKELEAEKEKLDADLATLESELATRKDKNEGIVQVRPGGSGVAFEPTFVECRKEGLVLFLEEGKPRNILLSQIQNDVVFLSTLDEISNSADRVMTFLLREDGVNTYYHARNIARSRYAKNGKLPVLGQGKLDLGLFLNKRD